MVTGLTSLTWSPPIKQFRDRCSWADILAVASVTNSVVPHGARAHLAKAASEVIAKREPKQPPSRGTVIGRDKRGTGTGVRKVVTPV